MPSSWLTHEMHQVLFSDLGAARTGTFFKESSKPGTSLEKAASVIDRWIQ
jgi:hypothetical protein